MMIKSILDNDLYKFTMQAAILALYPTVEGEYEFINRRPAVNKFTPEAVDVIRREIAKMADLRLTPEWRAAFKRKCPYLPDTYLDALQNYSFDPNEVEVTLNKDGDLKVHIKGLWWRTVLWEVPLMAIISETYFRVVETNWGEYGQDERIKNKGDRLSAAGTRYADFGTRRRRSFYSQERVVATLKGKPGFVGTSNVFLAITYGVTAIGTMAHEWLMAHQVIGDVRHTNRDALKAWQKVYVGELGIALTDTLGTDAFFKDFDPVLSRLFDGVRHDSGDPFKFIDKVVAHYESHRINPLSKSIVFSDGLDPSLAIQIAEACKGRILCSFGIGTNFTNDYDNSKALNIVIKLVRVNGVGVVKFSDVVTKAIGDMDARRVVRWAVYGTPLDASWN
jgi:nicotinate phosphoribosyltransferase